MGYKRADEVLPEYMLKILQEYAGGELLYVPKKERDRKRWGTGTGMGERLRLRDEKILRAYLEGASVRELAGRFFLSEKSIQRILRNMRMRPPMEERDSDLGGKKIEQGE